MSERPTQWVWSRFAANAVEHIAGPDGQPICAAYLHPERVKYSHRPSGLAPVCVRCQRKANR